MTDHSPLPWFVHETKHPHHLGGEHTERRIFTVAIHPQLKDHDGVVNGSVGLGPIEGGPPTHMVSISAEDAAFIVQAANNHEALTAARRTFLGYLQAENGCKRSGAACREKCACELELQGLVEAWAGVDVGGARE